MDDSFDGVRFARVEDESAIYDMLTLAHHENGLFSQDAERVYVMIRRATEKAGGIIGLIDGATGLEGIIVLVISQYWYTHDWHLEEVVNFVHPEHRRSTHARRLLEFAKWTQEKLSIPLLCGILTTHKLEAKMRLYQRQLPQVGAVFQHGLAVADTFNQRHLNETSSSAPDAPPLANGAAT